MDFCWLSFNPLKDTGRLTYHEMLLAFRRSQGSRGSRSSSRAGSRGIPTSNSSHSATSNSQSTKQTPNHTDDESFHFDYLPNQAATNQSPPEQSRRNDFQKHKIQPADIPYEPEPSEDDFAFPPPPEKDEPVYIRPSFPEKRNSRTRRARRDKYAPQIAKFKNESSKIQYENNQTPLATKRTYDQSAYG